MEGEPAYRRDEASEVPEQDVSTPRPPPSRGTLVFPVATLATAFGLAAAAAAVVRSGILSPAHDPFASGGGWLISAAAIAVIAAGWFAGAINLLLIWPVRRGTGSGKARSGWPAWLAAFAAGPFLVALFFFGTSLHRLPAPELIAYPAAAAILLVLLFAKSRVRLLAERLLLSFFLWVAILVAPTFWRDPVSDQLSAFLFGLLKAAGLLN